MDELFGTIIAVLLLMFLFVDDNTGVDNWDRINDIFANWHEEKICGDTTREEY